jgi:hypothetical protein
MRDLIIRAAMLAAYLLVWAIAITFAVSGYQSGPFFLRGIGLSFQAAQLVGAVLGGAIGFIVGSFAASILFLLRDIAESARFLVAAGVNRTVYSYDSRSPVAQEPGDGGRIPPTR